MEITKKKSKILVICMVLMMVLGIIIPTANDRVYAADGTITIKVGREIDYSSHFTHYFYAGDKDSPVYCAQPQLPTPPSGSYAYNFISPTSMLAKCLYYGYGGPGFYDYTDKQLKGSWDGEDDAYCLTHIIISIAYDKTTSVDVDPFVGLSGAWKTKAQTLYNYINTLPDPPKNYRAYSIKVSGCQDILGSFNDVGNIKIVKSSADKSMTDGNACYSLAGAKYGLYYGNTLIDTITTDSDGVGILENVLVANYTIKEISASKGYALDIKSYNCKVSDNTTTTLNVKEQPKDDPIGILLRKGDAETEKPLPQGSGTLQNAIYEVKYYKHTASGKSLAATWRFKTDKNGIAHFAKSDLDTSFKNSKFYYSAAGDPCIPLGTITVQEVKAPEGYLLNSKMYTREITAGSGTVESVYTYNTPEIGSDAEVAEQPKRGDLKLVKVKDGNMQRLANVQFKITSKTTGESHIVCTDENGVIDTSSSWNSHKTDTNGGTSESGVWFGEIGAIDDDKGALLYDYYTLDEIRGENNKNLKLLKNVEFRIYRDSSVLDLGTVTDDVVRINTTAIDSETKNHISFADGKATIIDTVKYKGLIEGREYTISGTLMDKATGEPVIVDGKKLTSEESFTCRNEDGTVDIKFNFNANNLKGKTLVVFEKCFDVVAKEEIASHEDINDIEQSIAIPEIGTKAIGKKTGLNIVSNTGKQAIIDTVKYENILKDEKYELKTWLVDENGSSIFGIKPVIKEFIAKDSNGSIATEISFDAEKMEGHDVIVFEELYIINKDSGKKEIVADHKNVNSKEQTISIPKIGTKASVEGTKDNVLKPSGKQTLVDTISYSNLISGKEYKIRTWLVDENGKKIEGTEIENKFVAEKKNGEVKVKITFDTSKLMGDKVVFFEEVYLLDSDSEILVGEHKDKTDDNQTLTIDRPIDSPKTGDNNIVWIFLIIAILAGGSAFALFRKNEKNE